MRKEKDSTAKMLRNSKETWDFDAVGNIELYNG